MNNQNMNIKNPTFGGFKPDAMSRIAKSMGYEGNMSGFQQYLDQNPDKRTQMDQFKQAAMMMARGGSVQKFQQGGQPSYYQQMVDKVTPQQQPIQTQPQPTIPKVSDPATGRPPEFVGGPALPMPIDPITGQPPITGGPKRPMPTPKDPIDSRPTPITPPELQPQPPVEEGPDLGGYDPSQGMPEALPEPDFSTGYVLPDYAEGQLKTIAMGDTNLGSATIEGNTVKFADGKTIKANTPEQAQMIIDAANKYKTEVQDPQKAKEEAYRNYLTGEASRGVSELECLLSIAKLI